MEISWNFVSLEKWEPCLLWWVVIYMLQYT